MELIFPDENTQKICENLKAAKKYFDGNIALATSLLARINALRVACNIKDIIVQSPFHFHKMKNKMGRDLEGYFAIDVKTRREPWRIILQPLDENKEPYESCNIDEIASFVRIVEISEVSKHYE